MAASLHHKNLQLLTIVMYKVLTELAPMVFHEMFEARKQNNYNLRHATNFIILWRKGDIVRPELRRKWIP